MKFNLGFCLCHTMQFFVCMPLWKNLWLYEPDPIVVGTNQTIWLVGDVEIFMYRTAGPEAVRCIIYSATLSRHLSVKGQMHHHNDLGSKCAYTCHLSNKTTRKSVLLSTPQIWLMKVSKKLA